MLKGEYSHNIDAKGRLIIPAKFRDDLGGEFRHNKKEWKIAFMYIRKMNGTTSKKKLNALPTTTDKKARAFAYFFQGKRSRRRTLINKVVL